MKPNFTSLTDPKYKQFKDHVNSFKQSRYYIIDFVSIAELREQGKPNDEIAAIAAEYFDDHEWPIRKDPTIPVPKDVRFPVVSEEEAKKDIIEDLCGGPNYGHTNYAIQPEEAEKIWKEFMSFFGDDKVLYGVSLGDTEYVFLRGVVVVDRDKAGVLNIVQND
jgi:hypothetical protein